MNRLLLTALAALALALPASAQTPHFGDDNPRGTFTNSFAAQANFLATLSSFGTDNIESHTPFVGPPILSFGATGITSTTNVEFVAQEPSLAVSGIQFMLDTAVASDVFTLSAPVNAFGLFIVQSGDLGNINTISLVLENTLTMTSKNVPVGTFGPGRDFDNVFFFGVTDTDPFNRITIVESLDGDGTLYDDVTVGFLAVPEPSTYALIGAGLAVVGFARWRQLRRNKK